MILVTGFAPFDGAQLNPSWEAVKGLAEIPDISFMCRRVKSLAET